MYRIAEYYWTGGYGKATGRVIKGAHGLPTVEAARTAAEAAYQEARRVPESECLVFLVHDASDHVVYSVPAQPGG